MDDTRRRWLLLSLSILECLLCTGVIFGLAALQIALKRDGAYEELCVNLNDASGDGTCNARQLKFNAMYTGGTVSVPLSMMFWGVLLDSKIGAKRVRWMSLMLFIVGCVLFAESDTRTFDAYIAACVLLSSGGAGFFLSHFQFCEHWKQTKYFGLSHSMINMAFDSSTVTFYAFEAMHKWKEEVFSIRAMFYGLGLLAALFAATTNEYVWGRFLNLPETAEVMAEKEEGLVEETKEESEDKKAALQYRGVKLTDMRFTEQLKTPFFWTVAVWSMGSIYRTMFVLGSIFEQLSFNNNGRSTANANTYVRLFNALILVSTFLTPFFGFFVDKFGLAHGFALVNFLGILAYGGLLFNHDKVTLSIAFFAFGCFRAWNYSCLTIYTQGVFGNKTFGKLYGIGIGVFAVVSGAMQYPSMHLVLSEKHGDGDFFVVDVLLISIGVALFAFPFWILRNGVVGAH